MHKASAKDPGLPRADVAMLRKDRSPKKKSLLGTLKSCQGLSHGFKAWQR